MRGAHQMKIPNVFVDASGRSCFGEIDLMLTGNNRRIQAKNQDVLYWQMAMMQPGHFIDFRPSEAPQFVSIMSGRMAITAGNGEVRYFSRGDLVMMRDLAGQGHTTRVLGHEPCTMLKITMPNNREFK